MKNIYHSIIKSCYLVLLLVTLSSISSKGQSYCKPSISNQGLPYNLYIENVALDSIDNTTTAPSSSPYYTLYNTMSTTIKTGFGYWVKITPGNSGYSKNMAVWIDFNGNDTFESKEKLGEKANMPNGQDSIYFSVPNNADTGATRMRVIFAYNQQNLTPCGSYSYGEAEDYVINIQYVACTTPPTPGIVITNNTAPCTGIPFILSLQGNSNGAGQSYQWQKSSDSVNWSDVSGATYDTTNQYQSASTYYRCMVTCSSNSDSTAAFEVVQNPFYNCYCSSRPSSGKTTNIANVTFGNFSNGVDTLPATNNTNVSATYSDYTGIGKIGLIRGSTYPFSVTQIDASSWAVCYIKVWIDYNQNGVYETSEVIYGGNTKSGSKGNTIHANITIPSGATYGITHMRVHLEYSGASSGSPCGTYSAGETEDYTVVIFDKAKKDVAIKSIVSPAVKSCFSGTEPGKVAVFNQGTDTLDFSYTNLNVHLEMSNLNTGTLDTVITSGKLAPSASMTVTFNQTLDMSQTGGDYEFVVSVSMAGDSIPYNDTVRLTVTPTVAIPLGYLQDFNLSYTIPASYTNNGFSYSNNTGLNGSDALEVSMSSSAKATATSELIGTTTSLSALKLFYKTAGAMPNKDTIFIQVSTDCGLTFKSVYSIITKNSHANKWDSIQYDLGASAGNNVIVKLLRSANAASSYTIYFDNLAIADRPDLNFGNDTAVCNSITLFANPNYNSWEFAWSKAKWIQDTLKVTSTSVVWCRAMDAIYGVWTIDTIKITVYPTPIANLGADQKICSGVNTILNPGTFPASYTYLWNTGDTSSTLTVSTSGTYIVSVTAPAGCYDADTVKITASNQPKGVYIIKGSPYNGQYNSGTATAPDNVCVGNTVTYEITPPSGHTNAKFGITWNIPLAVVATINGNTPAGNVTVTPPSAIGNGSLSYAANAADADSLYIITTTVIDSITACDTSVMRYISVNSLPSVNLGSDETVCPNTQVYLSSSGSFAQYKWSDGSTSNMLGISAPGDYWLKVTDNKGCTNNDTITINNHTVTNPNLGPDKNICPNDKVLLDGGNANAYLWSTNASTAKITISTAGTYWLKTTDANGCFAADSIDVNLLPTPDASFTYNITNGKSAVQFTATNTTHNKYTWTLGDGGNSAQISPAHTYTLTGAYIVKLVVTGTNGCSDSSTQTINVNTAINMPNALVNELTVFPNPYNHEASLNFNLIKNAVVNIELYDIYGRKINTLANGQLAEGKHQMQIATNNSAQAVYMLRITINGQSTVIRLIDLGNN
ncbi:MAG: GEVED domain-containing protein [Bacteroidota bacterium]|nr:GEVED domain-containing protein [Bacteroidota bacterium]